MKVAEGPWLAWCVHTTDDKKKKKKKEKNLLGGSGVCHHGKSDWYTTADG